MRARGPRPDEIRMHRSSPCRYTSCEASSVGQCITTSPPSVLGVAPQKAVTPCCRASAIMDMDSTMVRGSGSPREPGAGYRAFGTSYAAAAASACVSTRASSSVEGRPMQSGSACATGGRWCKGGA